MTNGIHRADFYHFIWVKGGELCLMVDFEGLRLKEEDTFLIAPGEVCQFHLYPHLHSRPEGYSFFVLPVSFGASRPSREATPRCFSWIRTYEKTNDLLHFDFESTRRLADLSKEYLD